MGTGTVPGNAMPAPDAARVEEEVGAGRLAPVAREEALEKVASRPEEQDYQAKGEGSPGETEDSLHNRFGDAHASTPGRSRGGTG